MKLGGGLWSAVRVDARLHAGLEALLRERDAGLLPRRARRRLILTRRQRTRRVLERRGDIAAPAARARPRAIEERIRCREQRAPPRRRLLRALPTAHRDLDRPVLEAGDAEPARQLVDRRAVVGARHHPGLGLR